MFDGEINMSSIHQSSLFVPRSGEIKTKRSIDSLFSKKSSENQSFLSDQNLSSGSENVRSFDYPLLKRELNGFLQDCHYSKDLTSTDKQSFLRWVDFDSMDLDFIIRESSRYRSTLSKSEKKEFSERMRRAFKKSILESNESIRLEDSINNISLNVNEEFSNDQGGETLSPLNIREHLNSFFFDEEIDLL